MATTQKYLSINGGMFYCLFVDFFKAFDSISREKLINCLLKKGLVECFCGY